MLIFRRPNLGLTGHSIDKDTILGFELRLKQNTIFLDRELKPSFVCAVC